MLLKKLLHTKIEGIRYRYDSSHKEHADAKLRAAILRGKGYRARVIDGNRIKSFRGVNRWEVYKRRK